MRTFPAEFADLLNPAGRAFLRRRKPIAAGVRAFTSGVPYIGFQDFLAGNTISACYRLLESAFNEFTFDLHRTMPPHLGWRSISDWSGSQRNRTNFFNKDWPEAMNRALEVNYLQMLRSSSVVEFAHKATGLPLFVTQDHSAQVSVYDEGDFVGPHCDAKGQNGRMHPFIDFHLSFPNRHVQSQWLMYEREAGYMSGMIDLNVPGQIGVYRLPLWHQVTPLQAKRGKARQARRWLMMGWMGIEGHGYYRLGRDFRYFPEDAELKPLHRAGPELKKPSADVALVEALASMLRNDEQPAGGSVLNSRPWRRWGSGPGR